MLLTYRDNQTDKQQIDCTEQRLAGHLLTHYQRMSDPLSSLLVVQLFPDILLLSRVRKCRSGSRAGAGVPGCLESELTAARGCVNVPDVFTLKRRVQVHPHVLIYTQTRS